MNLLVQSTSSDEALLAHARSSVGKGGDGGRGKPQWPKDTLHSELLVLCGLRSTAYRTPLRIYLGCCAGSLAPVPSHSSEFINVLESCQLHRFLVVIQRNRPRYYSLRSLYKPNISSNSINHVCLPDLDPNRAWRVCYAGDSRCFPALRSVLLT